MPVPATLDTWDYVSLSIMVASTTLIAFYHVFNVKKRKDNMKEFLVSGKNIGFFPILLSTVATAISPISMQGFPLEIYMSGANFMLLCIPTFIVMPIFAFVFMPVYYNLGISSIFQYLEYRFNRKLRMMASIIYTSQTVFYTSCVLYAPSLALNQATGLDLWSSVIAIGVVCIAYTALGGIKAVIWADVIQLLVMFIVILVVLIKGCMDVGGPAIVWERALAGGRLKFHVFPSPDAKDTIWTYLIGNSFSTMAFMVISQMFVQRFLSNKTISRANWSLTFTSIIMTIVMMLFFITGYVMYGKYYDCDPYLNGRVTSRDQYVPLFAVETLSFVRGFAGIYIAGVLCASLSTLSSVLNALSAVTLTDYIKPFCPSLSDAKEKTLSKVLVTAYGVACIGFVALAANMGGVVRAVFIIGGASAGPIFSLFSLGVLFPWTNELGAMIGFLTSLGLGLWAAIGSLLSVSHIPTSPLSVAGCNISSVISNFTDWTSMTFSTSQYTSNILNSTDIYPSEAAIMAFNPVPEFFLYTLSPLWYGMMTGLVGITVGIVASILLGVQDPEKIDPRLISPPIEKLYRSLPESIRQRIGYTSSKMKTRQWDKTMDYRNGNETSEVKIPLQSKNKDEQSTQPEKL